MNTIIKEIIDLYKKIPTFKCKDGCTDCCGPVPFAKAEWERIEDKREDILLDCAYSLLGKCDIYEQRPLMCRLFGASFEKRLICPYGCKPNFPLTVFETRQIMDKYLELMDK